MARTVLVAAVAAMTGGPAALTSAPARAASLAAVSGQAGIPMTGSELGDLTLSPASGSVSAAPTWSTSTPCPSGFQGSAVLDVLNTDSSIVAQISPVVASVASPFGGTLLAGDTVGSVLAAASVTDARTVEWVVACSAGTGGTGSTTYMQATDVTLSVDGASYATSCTQAGMCLLPPSGASSLTPTWATVGACPAAYLFSAALYTLNADGSLGTRISPVVDNVEAPFGGTLLADVAQDMSGTGVAAGESDDWVVVCFGPSGLTPGDDAYQTYVALSQDGSLYFTSSTLPVLTGTSAGATPVMVTIPPAGTFTVTVEPGATDLTVQGTAAPAMATGTLTEIVVADTRNTYPGWSVYGQMSSFAGSGPAAGSTFSGDQLSWVPSGIPAGGATLGPANTSGLGDTAQVLASALPGSGVGTSILGAALTLDIPATALAGPYTGTLTITYLDTGP